MCRSVGDRRGTSFGDEKLGSKSWRSFWTENFLGKKRWGRKVGTKRGAPVEQSCVRFYAPAFRLSAPTYQHNLWLRAVFDINSKVSFQVFFSKFGLS